MRVSALTLAFSRRTANGVTAVAALAALAVALGACSGLVKKTPEACSVTIAPRDISVPVNSSQTVVGTAFDCDGNSIAKRTTTFSSANSAIASVTKEGVVIGVSIGTTTVSAAANGKTADATVNVIPEHVASASVTPGSITLRKTNVRDFVAVAKNQLGTVIPGITFQWSSSNSSIAFVDNSGKVTALAVGFANITATADGQTASSSVTVTEVPIGKCDLSPLTQQIIVGQQGVVTPALKDTAQNALSSTGRTLSWSSDNEIFATVSTTGIVTAKKAGTVVIKATNPENTSVSCQATVVVINPEIKTADIQPKNAVVRVGIGRQFSVQILDKNNAVLSQTDRNISWRPVTPSIATVSATGLVTGVAVGFGRVAVDAEGVVDTVTFEVKKIPVASVSVAPLQRTVFEGQTAQFTPTVIDSAGNTVTDRPLEWTVSDPSKASVTSTGLVTAIAAGNVTVTANSVAEGKSGAGTLIIQQAPVDTIILVQPTFTLAKNTNSPFSITLRDAAGNQLRNRTVIVTSDQPSIATGSANSQATAVTVTGVNVGSATLTMQAVNANGANEGKASTILVTVTAATVPIVTPPGASAIKRE